MMRKQLFVERGGHFSQENRVLVILKQLGTLREPAVHGVTGFVRKRVNVRENVLFIIHQDVRRRLVAPG